MKALFDRLCAIGALAWMRFVQSLNAIAMTLLGGALVVHQSYPSLLGDLLGPIPLPVKALLLFLFGSAVHLAMRRAKAEVRP